MGTKAKRDICGECGNEYGNLSYHWAFNEEHRPNMSERQKEITKGLCMGDGYISTKNKFPYLEVQMVNEKYLIYLQKVFGNLSTGVRKKMSAKESAEHSRNVGLNEEAKEENYSDLFSWSTRTHPELSEFSEWYSSGKLVWPKDLVLTPTSFKHWYVSDGNWDTHGTANSIRIATDKEYKNKDKVEDIIKRSGLPEPDSWPCSERRNGTKASSLSWSNIKTKKVFEYMDGPVPGFEYKFPTQ